MVLLNKEIILYSLKDQMILTNMRMGLQVNRKLTTMDFYLLEQVSGIQLVKKQYDFIFSASLAILFIGIVFSIGEADGYMSLVPSVLAFVLSFFGFSMWNSFTIRGFEFELRSHGKVKIFSKKLSRSEAERILELFHYAKATQAVNLSRPLISGKQLET